MHLGKPICAPPHLRSFPNDSSESETVPVLVWLMITFHVLHRTSSITFFFHASVLQVTDGVMTFVLCLNIVFQAPQQMLATFDDCFAHQSFWLDVSLYSSISGAVHEGGSRTLSHTLTFCLPFYFSFSLSLFFSLVASTATITKLYLVSLHMLRDMVSVHICVSNDSSNNVTRNNSNNELYPVFPRPLHTRWGTCYLCMWPPTAKTMFLPAPGLAFPETKWITKINQ